METAAFPDAGAGAAGGICNAGGFRNTGGTLAFKDWFTAPSGSEITIP